MGHTGAGQAEVTGQVVPVQRLVMQLDVVGFVLVVCVVFPEVARLWAPAFSLTESIRLTTGGVTTANRPHCWRKARRSLFDRSSFASIFSPPGTEFFLAL